MSILRFFRRTRDDTPPEEREAASLLCMILSQRSTAPDDAEVRAALGTAFGRKASISESGGGTWILRAPALPHAVLSFMPLPVPDGEAESAADSFLWPGGSRFAGHASHFVLGCSGVQHDRVGAALALTRLGAALLEPCGGTAIYWGAGSITVPRNHFIEKARHATRKELPLLLWCRFQLTQPDGQPIGMYTVGLEQFGLMEIEVDGSSWDARRLFGFVYDLAHYLVQSGAVIRDGDTVGGSAEERITVRYGRSAHDASRSVYQLVGT